MFLFFSFAKLLLICSKTQNLWPTTKSLIAHVFSSVSWGYHRWGYGFGLVSVGTGGPSYDVEALTIIVRQGDEIIPLKIGPLVHFWSIDFLPFLLTFAGLFQDQKISVYKFACFCLRDTDGSLGGEDKPQPLQFEARGIWKGVSHWRKIRTRKRTTKIRRMVEQQMSLDLRSEKWHKSLEILQHHDHAQAPASHFEFRFDTLGILTTLAFMKIFDTLGFLGTFGRLWHTLTLLAQ